MANYSDIKYQPAGSATTTYSDMAALIAATGMSAGDQALVTALNKVFMYTGTAWYVVATMTNDSPTAITGVNGTYQLATDGTATTVTAVSSDPEGFPLTWSYAVTTGSLGSTATVSQADNVFTITPSTNSAHEGGFSITFSVTDGATGAVNAVSAFTLAFIPTANYLVIGGGGSGGSRHGGGGGAGEYRIGDLTPSTGVTYQVVIGAGGGTPGSSSAGNNGSLSSVIGTGFNASANGGGGGGTYAGTPPSGTLGSSGGSASANTRAASNSGSADGTPYSNIGGTGNNDSSGGGGGAGQVGAVYSGSTGGAGGDGLTWLDGVTRAGGGGGGSSGNNISSGGAGGGGDGVRSFGATVGTANTGSGGGASRSYSTGSAGAAGGSGVVIFRIPETSVAPSTTGSPIITTSSGFKYFQFNSNGSFTWN